MKIVFMGTPDFAVPSLDVIVKGGHKVLAVVCQPDREKDRRGRVVPSPIKERAVGYGLSVLQFENIKKEGTGILQELAPDIIVTAAYGQILSEEILSIAKYGVINVHASLLPKYRGSSPIQWAVINGEKETGVTIMQTARGVDSGDIIAAVKTPIPESETAGELFDRLSVIGANLLEKVLRDIENGTAKRTPQDESMATRCGMIRKADGLIDWNKSAESLKDFIRGMNPWPIAHSYLEGKRINIWKAEVYTGAIALKLYSHGEVCFAGTGGAFVAACGNNTFLKLTETQAEGKNRMNGAEMLKGLKLSGGCGFNNER